MNSNSLRKHLTPGEHHTFQLPLPPFVLFPFPSHLTPPSFPSLHLPLEGRHVVGSTSWLAFLITTLPPVLLSCCSPSTDPASPPSSFPLFFPPSLALSDHPCSLLTRFLILGTTSVSFRSSFCPLLIIPDCATAQVPPC